VTLDGHQTVGSLNFDNANTYEIAQGSAGTLTVSQQINVLSGHHLISAPLVLSGQVTADIHSAASLQISGPLTISDNQTFIITGPGLATISGPQTHGQSANLFVLEGNLHLDRNLGHPAVGPAAPDATVTLTIGGTSKVTLGADQDLQSLSLDPSNYPDQALDLNSPTDAAAFRSLRIYQLAIKQTLYQAIADGVLHPNTVVFDSGLASHPNSALGIALISDLNGSQYVLVRPTRIGDLNLDGIVTIADFIDLASHFGSSGPDITWQEGDLNYDNAVTISDFIDLASNFGSSYSGTTFPISPEDQKLLSDFAAAHGASVPEPSALLLIAPTLLLFARARNCTAKSA